MSTMKLSLERPRVVCHVDASSTAAAVMKAAGAYCRRRNAELIVVRVLEPSSFHPSPLPVSAGGTGIWGISGAAAAALELARREGITARAVVRFGDPGRVLEEERRTVGAERVFTRADVGVEPAAVSLDPSRTARLESDAA